MLHGLWGLWSPVIVGAAAKEPRRLLNVDFVCSLSGLIVFLIFRTGEKSDCVGRIREYCYRVRLILECTGEKSDCAGCVIEDSSNQLTQAIRY